MLENRPIALTLIAATLLYQGIEAFVGMIGSLSDGRVNINFVVIMLFAGIGLLRLSNGWRMFTLFCLVLGAVIMAGLVVFEVIFPGKVPVRWFGTVTSGVFRYMVFAVVEIFAGAIIWWAYRTLTSPTIEALFKPQPTQQPEPSR